MVRSVSRGIGRRVSLLSSSSLILGVMLSGGVSAVTTFLPQSAIAAPTACAGTDGAPAASPGGSVECPAGSTTSLNITSNAANTALTLDSGFTTTAGGVSLTSTGDQTLSVTLGGGATSGITATGTGSADAGVLVSTQNGGASIDTGAAGYTIAGGTGGGLKATATGAGAVSIAGAAAVTTTGDTGILATNGTGSVSVGSSSAAYGGAVTGAENGVVANGSGAVGVYVGANVEGTGNDAISATSSNGAVTVSATGGSLTGGVAGIVATATGGDTSVTSGDTISAGTGHGIDARSYGGDTTVSSTAAITAGDDGIHARAYGGGDVTVTSTAAIDATSDGISARAWGGGDVSVTNGGAITSGTGSVGIDARSTGAGAITINSTGAVTGGVGGISAEAFGTGAVTVSQDGDMTTDGDGIDASGAAAVTVNYSASGVTRTLTSSGDYGVQATSSGGVATVNVGKTGGTGTTTIKANVAGVLASGDTGATVVLGDKVTIDPDNYGVLATSAGSTSVSTGDHDSITVDDNVVPGSDDKNYGIFAESSANADATSGSTTTPSVSVALGANNTITVQNSATATGQVDGGLGIGAINDGSGTGSVSVSTGDGLSISVVGNNAGGIGAATSGFNGATGAGNVTVSTGTGSITVAGGANTGDTANNFSTGSFGIGAQSNGGNVSVTTGANISVSNNAPNSAYGVYVSTTGAGTATVTTNGSVTVTGTPSALINDTGINVSAGTGLVTVNVNGALTAAGTGVSSNSTGNVALNVGSKGSITGLSGTSTAPVQLTYGTSKSATISNSGAISASGATAAAQAGDVAIRATGGVLSVTNNAGGTITGLLDVANVAVAPAGTTTVALTNAGTWNIGGTQALTDGDDTLLNQATGVINTVAGKGAAGLTTIDLGLGTNTFTNQGTIKVGGASAGSATLTVAGITTLNNSGVIDVHDGANDRSFVTTATLAASGGSQLYVDASLGGPDSASSNVQIGAATGVTSIRVNNSNANGAGGYISDPAHGIVLVRGDTQLSLANFTLASTSTGANGLGLPTGATNGIAAPGLFFYDLATSGNDIVLVSAPKVVAFQFAQAGAIAGDTWLNTTQSWFDRQADLRETLGDRAIGSAPAVWMKIVGDWSRRDSGQTVTLNGHTYGYDTSYRTDSAAVIAGVDLLHGMDKSSAWVVGVQGGYVDTNARFRNSDTRLNLTGGIVGVYASYLRGGLFVDGIVNGNILTGDWNLPSMNVPTGPWDASSHVNTWGGQLEAGYSLPIGAASFIEPLGSIAYGRTSTGALNLPGATQNFADADTLRGSLGGRIGTTAAFQYYKVKVALEGRVWDEFDGKTNTLLDNSGNDFLNGNDISGVYGEVKGEANLFAAGNNLSAFVNTGIKWKAHYQDTTVSLGMRYQW